MSNRTQKKIGAVEKEAPRSEVSLYAPIKDFLEGMGFEVKAEVSGADVVAVRGEALLVVELKTRFSLTLLQQGVERQKLTDVVYVAVPLPSGRAAGKAFRENVGLCRRLGLGVLSVSARDQVVVEADPGPYQPRPQPKRRDAMLKEFQRRRGDPNTGGTRGKIETAYRQDARDCAQYLAANGSSRGRDVAGATGVSRATRIMADNHYGWFCRVQNGIYDLTQEGRAALVEN